MEEIQLIRSKCVTFMLTVALELEQRFPKVTFGMNNFAFIDPRNRELRTIDVNRLDDRFPCNKEKLLTEYATYKFDQNVDDIFQHCKGDIVKFWSTLKVKGYQDLSSIAFDILVVSPENATCESAFSVIKYIRMTNTLVLHNYTWTMHFVLLWRTEVTPFPFEQLLHWHWSHATT